MNQQTHETNHISYFYVLPEQILLLKLMPQCNSVYFGQRIVSNACTTILVNYHYQNVQKCIVPYSALKVTFFLLY